MKFCIFTFISFLFIKIACAEIVELPISEAMSSNVVQTNLSSEVTFHFGKNNTQGKEIGTWVSNKKTNKVGKSIKESCYRAFASAIISLQARAIKENANKVAKIHSYYKKVPFYSNEYFRCDVGNIMSGVALRGTVMK